VYVGHPGHDWPLKQTYPTPRSIVLDLRSLGYETSARGGEAWHASPRDRLEIQAFARDYARAFPCAPHPDYSGQLTDANVRALDRAASNPGRFAALGMLPPSCCIECHFEFEDRHVLPYVYAAGMEPEAKALALEHIDLIGADSETLERHAAEEMDLFRRANVPQRLLAYLDAEHREIMRGDMPWKKR